MMMILSYYYYSRDDKATRNVCSCHLHIELCEFQMECYARMANDTYVDFETDDGALRLWMESIIVILAAIYNYVRIRFVRKGEIT